MFSLVEICAVLENDNRSAFVSRLSQVYHDVVLFRRLCWRDQSQIE